MRSQSEGDTLQDDKQQPRQQQQQSSGGEPKPKNEILRIAEQVSRSDRVIRERAKEKKPAKPGRVR